MVWVPPLRCGQPAVLTESGVELELAFGLYVTGVGVEGLASYSAAAADRRVGEQMRDRVRGDMTRAARHVGFNRLSSLHAGAAHAAK